MTHGAQRVPIEQLNKDSARFSAGPSHPPAPPPISRQLLGPQPGSRPALWKALLLHYRGHPACGWGLFHLAPPLARLSPGVQGCNPEQTWARTVRLCDAEREAWGPGLAITA